MARAFVYGVFAAWGSLLFASPAGAQTSAYLPLGQGVLVEETPIFSAHTHKVGVACRNADDLAIVVWWHPASGSVEGRLFLGQDPLGGQMQIGATGSDQRPAVGLDDTGGFVVGWISPPDGTVRRRRLDGTTLTWGPELVVARPDARSISLGPDGGFAVTWVDDTLLKGQRYDPVGSPQGQVFEVVWPTHDPSVWGNSVRRESVVISVDGAPTMVWATRSGNSSNGDSYTSIRAQRFDPAGTPVGSETVIAQANAPFIGDIWESVTDPRTAPDGSGGFFVLYDNSYWDQNGGVELERVRASRFDADGAPLLSNVFVTSPDCEWCWQRGLTARANGDFMAMWTGLTACRYPDVGSGCDPEFRVSDHPPVNGVDGTDIAYCGATSDIVAAWVSDDCGVGGADYCLWARWFGSFPEIFADGFESGDTEAWSDSLLSTP